MRIIEPHCHMISRVTDDYERMALAGIEAVVEPSFWLVLRAQASEHSSITST